MGKKSCMLSIEKNKENRYTNREKIGTQTGMLAVN
jgi:hypothetical protein